MPKKTVQLGQLNNKMQVLQPLQQLVPPGGGWVNAVRGALGITLQQLANKLQVTKQNVRMLELREADGSISLKTLKQAADALDMQLVYGLIPKDGSLEQLIERKARALAQQIVERSAHTMMLEDQEVSYTRLQKSIEEKTATYISELPKVLWD